MNKQNFDNTGTSVSQMKSTQSTGA